MTTIAAAVNALRPVEAVGRAGDGTLAQAMFRRAIAVVAPDGHGTDHDAPQLLRVWNNLANLQVDRQDANGALDTLRTALSRYAALPSPLQRECAPIRIVLLQGLSRVRLVRRQFAAAQAVLEEAIALAGAVARERGAPPPGEPAHSLVLLGAALAARGAHAEALPVFEEALRLTRTAASSRDNRRRLITTLNNLAGAAGSDGQYERAGAAYQEAVDLQRALAQTYPDMHGQRLVELLTNLGTTLLNAGDHAAAIERLEEAVERGRELHRRRPDSSRLVLVTALDRLCAARGATGDDDRANRAAVEAVDLAEQARTSEDMWLWKGWAIASYDRLLAKAIRAGDQAGAHACLAALRSPAVSSRQARAEQSLVAATAALSHVDGPLPRIVIGQRLADVDVLGVLDAHGLHLELTTTVAGPAKTLFDAILSVFDLSEGDEIVATDDLAAAATAVMHALPAAVRDALEDDSGLVLISGDPYWRSFPWEALCTGAGPTCLWLGLERSLVRAPGLTASAVNTLRDKHIDPDPGEPTAVIISPWDAVAEAPLESARHEAERVAERLQRRGYTLVPDQAPLLGPAANATNLLGALERRPAVVHYCGHADVIDGQEILLLAGDDGMEVPFGHTDLRGDTADEPLLPQKPLVVLNGCHAAHARVFGGQQEDLLSTMLTEGAGAVVASAFPVDELVGTIVGTLIYDGPPAEDIGTAVVRIRRALADRDDPIAAILWTLVTCHGNPLARLT